MHKKGGRPGKRALGSPRGVKGEGDSLLELGNEGQGVLNSGGNPGLSHYLFQREKLGRSLCVPQRLARIPKKPIHTP